MRHHSRFPAARQSGVAGVLHLDALTAIAFMTDSARDYETVSRVVSRLIKN
jgi:hypothetical protein